MYQKFAILALIASTEALRLECGPCCGGGADEEEVREELIEETFETSDVATEIIAEVLDSNPETVDQVEEIVHEVEIVGGWDYTEFLNDVVEEEVEIVEVADVVEDLPEPVEEVVAEVVAAVVYSNADCTGDFKEWSLEEGQESLRLDFDHIWNSGWDNRGQSVIVSPGYQFNLWQHPNFGGIKLEFIGGPECQDLNVLKNEMSDSEVFLVSEAPAAAAIVYTNADCTGDSYSLWNLYDGEESLRYNWSELNARGWNDRGMSVMVPEGF